MAYRALIDGIEISFDRQSHRWTSMQKPSFAKHLNAIPLESLIAIAHLENDRFPNLATRSLHALVKVLDGQILEAASDDIAELDFDE